MYRDDHSKTTRIAEASRIGYPRGMVRIILHLLLVANILACPLRCMPCYANSWAIVAAEKNVNADACECCHSAAGHQQTSSPQCEQNNCDLTNNHLRHCNPDGGSCPCEDCLCTNCICAGATLTSPSQAPQPDGPLVEAAFSDAAAGTLVTCRHLSDGLANCKPMHSLKVGRSMRIAQQSWII